MLAVEPQEVAPVAIRPMVEDDRAFILATWLRAYKHNSPFTRKLGNDLFFTNHHPIAEAILARSRVYVATLEDAPEVIIGYLVTEHRSPPTAHFAYVKKEFRRMRVLSALIEESDLPSDLAGVAISHGTFDWFDYLAPKFPGAVVNPYLQVP